MFQVLAARIIMAAYSGAGYCHIPCMLFHLPETGMLSVVESKIQFIKILCLLLS
jgi:hypothetical protein